MLGPALRDCRVASDGTFFLSSAFEFVLVDCIILAVIIQALYIIGGYSRNTETRSLIYATEHILAIIGAAVVSSMIIYSAAAFEVTMKPSRGVLLVSFIAFLPISLAYRRFLQKRIAASTAQRPARRRQRRVGAGILSGLQTIAQPSGSGQARGFAFVEMNNTTEADQAINALNGTDVDGRTLNVNEARPKTSGGTGRGNSSGGGYGRKQSRW